MHRTHYDGIADKPLGAGVACSIEFPLLGEFNVQNVLAAVGAVTAIKPQPTMEVLGLINQLEVVPGRMEWFKTHKSATWSSTMRTRQTPWKKH